MVCTKDSNNSSIFTNYHIKQQLQCFTHLLVDYIYHWPCCRVELLINCLKGKIFIWNFPVPTEKKHFHIILLLKYLRLGYVFASGFSGDGTMLNLASNPVILLHLCSKLALPFVPDLRLLSRWFDFNTIEIYW